MRSSLRALSLCLTTVCSGALAQETQARFEVASIKVNPEARGPWNVPGPGGRINYSGNSLIDLIAMAWNISPDRIFGGSGWALSTRFDVLAKPEDGATQGMTMAQTIQYDRLAMRSLLIDRFRLDVHVETKESPIYALVVARKDGRLGHALTEPKEASCREPDLSTPPALPENGKLPELSCGLGVLVWKGRLRAAHIKLEQLAAFLGRVVDRPVVDETALQQTFDIDMDWPISPKRLQSSLSDQANPSVFSALEEQLGLKLESRKGLVDALVIDHAERLSEN